LLEGVVRARRHVAALVVGLGVAQLLAWGALYYAIAVIGAAVRAELRVTDSELFGAFTWALVISGVLAPWAGRMLDRYGGRSVLVASALVGAVGFMTLARAESFAGLLVSWSLNGLAMALGLYDTCFAALGQVEPDRYRRTVTGVTLIAGFASTVSWPASHYLLQAIGWRALCDGYAGALGVCAMIYFTVLPRGTVRLPAHDAAVNFDSGMLEASAQRRARLLALAFAGSALISGSMSAHLLSVLHELELPSDLAVWAASSIGVMQVLGRLLELAFGAKHDASRLGLATFSALCASMAILLTVFAAPWAVVVFALVYGIANGLMTIAKATLPVEIFGLENVGVVLGNFSAPSLVTRALAPLGFAVATGALGTRGALVCMAAVGVATLVAYVAAMRSPSTRAEAARA
jgi:MFS family permease